MKSVLNVLIERATATLGIAFLDTWPFWELFGLFAVTILTLPAMTRRILQSTLWQLPSVSLRLLVTIGTQKTYRFWA